MMFRIRHYLLGMILALFFVGCGGNSSSGGQILGGPFDGPFVGSSFDENEKSYLYNLFQTEYYWNDQVPPSFDYSPYSEPQSMIDDLKYSAIDHWSMALSWQEYDDIAMQNASGFGFGNTEDFTIYLVLIDSPAQSAGLMRGDKIISINGQPVSEMLITQTGSAMGRPAHFSVERFGAILDITIIAQYYNYRVTSADIVQSPAGNQVGYLRFDAFTDSATDELETAFTYLKSQNIDKLVIDLRYNGGGYINTASILLDKIGRDFNGELQTTLVWNEQSSNQNESLYFDSLDPNSLSLKKLVFLTTGDSASASELVINAMKPYMYNDVVIVGETTHGKPVGMAGRTNGSYVYFLINFVVQNAEGFYDYFNGLPPDCNVVDNDYAHQLGDPNEALLSEALYYIDTNHCR
ncbi:MAG: S41 family peptidase [Campylobacterota bacterium]|nr:S41 family peptidase [Campylobacterota bacterium]